MIKIHISGRELWDESKQEFIEMEDVDLELEHSLVSISKWEAKYHKPFLSSTKTAEETLDYILMMNIKSDEIPLFCLQFLTPEQIKEVGDYISDPMTAAIINEEEDSKGSFDAKNKFVTSDEIYYWMTAQNIPFECQYWHLNRLITLIKICAINNKPKDNKNKRLTSSDLAKRRARMEAARKKYGG